VQENRNWGAKKIVVCKRTTIYEYWFSHRIAHTHTCTHCTFLCLSVSLVFCNNSFQYICSSTFLSLYLICIC